MELLQFEISQHWFWGPWLACHKEYRIYAHQPPYYRFVFPLNRVEGVGSDFDSSSWILQYCECWRWGLITTIVPDSAHISGAETQFFWAEWFLKKKLTKKLHKLIVEKIDLPDRLYHHYLPLCLGFCCTSCISREKIVPQTKISIL